jgi:hypothetical protein
VYRLPLTRYIHRTLLCQACQASLIAVVFALFVPVTLVLCEVAPQLNLQVHGWQEPHRTGGFRDELWLVHGVHHTENALACIIPLHLGYTLYGG